MRGDAHLLPLPLGFEGGIDGAEQRMNGIGGSGQDGDVEVMLVHVHGRQGWKKDEGKRGQSKSIGTGDCEPDGVSVID